jgi:SPP1 gp7 family putative phage head morphogenesis protein
MIQLDEIQANFLKSYRTEMDSQYDEWLNWQTLQEELLAAKIEKWFGDQRLKTLQALEGLADVYDDTKKTASFIDTLLASNLLPVQRFKSVDKFLFSTYTFPVRISEKFRKGGDPIADQIKVISQVNSEGLADVLNEASSNGVYGGGQSGLNSMGINLGFQVLGDETIAALTSQNIKLTSQLEESMTSKIRYELLDGIKNFESIPELRDRILSVYDKPVTVSVPASIHPDGTVARKGYTYDLSAQQWANTVARTEITRAFVTGRLEAYKQSGIVKEVEFLTAGDERVCMDCSALDATVYKLDESFGEIPVHASCRCTFIPYIDAALMDQAFRDAGNNIANAYASGDPVANPLTFADWAKSEGMAGRDLSNFTIRANQVFGEDFLVNDLLKGFSTDVSGYETLLSEIEFTKQGFGITQARITGEIMTVDGELAGEFTRMFYRSLTGQKELTVGHELLFLESEYQGVGLVKGMMKNSIAMYDRLGAVSVSLTANGMVGSYAWAKYGFDFETKYNPEIAKVFSEEFKTHIAQKIKTAKVFKTEAELTKYMKTVDLSKLQHSWDFAAFRAELQGVKISGKEFLLESGGDWRGVLELDKNSSGRKIVDAYTSGKLP